MIMAKQEKIHWDVKIGDKIECFDPELSYELTGYRPINKTQGLDFNPDWFREDAISKLNTGNYSGTMIGSKPYVDFWKERFRRINEGYESNGYRITGDYYFFLNFYNLKSSEESTIFQEYSFPSFLVFQYEFFHYTELCELLQKDVAILKSRGIGLSESISSMAVRRYTGVKNSRCLLSAFSDAHLKPTLGKIWYQLDWLNSNTENAFRRIRMAENTQMHKKAAKKNKDGSVHGWLAEIQGQICDNADKLRGDRVQLLLYEEAGADIALDVKWVKGDAIVGVLGDKRVGFKIAVGTGGSATANSMDGLKDLVLNPEASNVLPYKHNHTPTGQYIYSGYFIPSYAMVFSVKDERGYCDPVESKQVWLDKRATMVDTPKKLLSHSAEYCFTIEEALLQQDSNMFPREELAEQLTNFEIYDRSVKPVPGHLVWEVDKENNRTGNVYFREDPNGKVLILERPILGEDGKPYLNLYVGGIDSIDIGQKDSATLDQSRLSKFCITIKKRMFGLDDPKYVAIYLDRPRDISEAYENAAKMLTYFGCKAVLESARTAILTYFRNHKYLNLLMTRPRSTLSDIKRGNSKMYGAPATIKVIDHYRELIYDFCLHYSHTIFFREMLEQLLNYNDADKKRYDIVAAMGFTELGDEELSAKKPQERNATMKTFRDFGYWTDSNGIKRYGVIPKNEYEESNYKEFRREDPWSGNEFI